MASHAAATHGEQEKSSPWAIKVLRSVSCVPDQRLTGTRKLSGVSGPHPRRPRGLPASARRQHGQAAAASGLDPLLEDSPSASDACAVSEGPLSLTGARTTVRGVSAFWGATPVQVGQAVDHPGLRLFLGLPKTRGAWWKSSGLSS